MELNDNERMFVAQGIYKYIASAVDTKPKDGPNMRSEFNERYVSLYEQTGAKSFDAKVMGEKVGTVTVKPGEAREPYDEPVFEVADADALNEWFASGADDASLFAAERMGEYAQWHFNRTGELPGGCEFKMRRVQPQQKPPTVTLRIDPEKVATTLESHGMLGGAVALALPSIGNPLLEGGM